jgi:hypothetical protein
MGSEIFDLVLLLPSKAMRLVIGWVAGQTPMA